MRPGGGSKGMERRQFTNLLGTGILGAEILGAGRAAMPGQARMAKSIKACVITHRQGAHLSHYFAALAEAGEVAEVALSDPGGDTTQDARRALGEKLTSVYTSPEEMLAKMLEALAPGGKVVLLEYRAEAFRTASHIKPEHRMTVRDVLAEWNLAGFELVDLLEFLPSQHLFIFQKRPDRD